MHAWQLNQRQSLSLEAKTILSQLKIREWYEAWEGNVYISLSGGKDSTALLHLVRSLYPEVPAIFVDTGLEYPEIRNFIKTIENVIWFRPEMNFQKVIEHYGYPVISKECSQALYELRNYNVKPERRERLLYGPNEKCKGWQKVARRWHYLLNAPFEISDACCKVMKKQPLKQFEKRTGAKMITGEMATESRGRKTSYLKKGCNGFDLGRPKSMPLAFWTEEDVWNYLKIYNIPYSSIYDMGYERTGCMFCMYGIHLEQGENRFQRMKRTHPKQWDYCINKLGLGEVLEHIGVVYC